MRIKLEDGSILTPYSFLKRGKKNKTISRNDKNACKKNL